MFSVSASPFNSKPRQLYGGWTVAEAKAAKNLWALRKAMAMESKYGSNPADVLAARKWLRDYNETRKSNPAGMRLAMNQARRAAGLGVVRKRPLSQAQKKAILDYWRDIPLADKSPLASYRRSLISRAPFPSYGYMIKHPEFQFPMQDLDPAVMNSSLTAEQMMMDPTMFFDTSAARKAWMKEHPEYKALRFDKAALGPKHVLDPSEYLGSMATVRGAYEPDYADLPAVTFGVKQEDEMG